MLDRLVTGLHLQNLDVWAIVDILVLALLIYNLLLLIRGTRSVNVAFALLGLLLIYVVTGPGMLDLAAMHTTLGNFLIYVPLAIIVLFQNQIRQGLANLGRNPISSLLPKRHESNLIEEITLAAAALASKRVGALIVIEREMGLRTFCETGIELDAVLSYDLLMNLFTRRSPLHDGAVIVVDSRIKAASCFLPLTQNPTLSRSFGTRHRAAIGITEESDAIAVIASEERGVVSFVSGGKIQGDLDAQSLRRLLTDALEPNAEMPAAKIARDERQPVVAAGPTDA